MVKLNFPEYNLRIKNSEKGFQIFDIVRRKFVVLQPEEWVRQHVIHFLKETKGFPLSLINVEKQFTLKNLKKRMDVVVYNSDGSIHVLIECKAFDHPITQEVFDQIARYNLEIKSNYLMVTNGIKHYYAIMDYKKEKYTFLADIPDFSR